MLKKMGSFTRRASSMAMKSQFIIEVNKITFSDSNETPIGSEMNVGSDNELLDGVSSTITTKGEINFMKSFSLHVTLYRDNKKDIFLEKLRKIYIKIRSPRESNFKSFGTIQFDLAQYTSSNKPQEISIGVNDCLVVAAIVSLSITYVPCNQDQSFDSNNTATNTTTSNSHSSSSSSSSASASARIDIPENGSTKLFNDQQQMSSPLTSSPSVATTGSSEQRITTAERRNSVQRRSSIKGSFLPIDEIDDGDEERSNRATKELVERIQKQNEEYKKTNHLLKSQLDQLTDQLIEVNLQRAELLTNIDHEILEKRRLKERLQWYDWGSDVLGSMNLNYWIQLSQFQNEGSALPEPDVEELKDTE